MVFPVVVLVAFASYVILEKWHQYNSAEVLQNRYQYSIKLSDVVHAMQRERGLTAGFVGSSGRLFFEALKTQRQETDRLIIQLQKSDYKTFLRLPYGKVRERRNELILRINKRHIWRDEADRLIAGNFFSQYSQANQNAIYLMQALGDSTDDTELLRLNRTYVDLLWIQEHAGTERGAVNGILTAGVLDTKAIATVNGYVAKQNLLIEELKELVWLPVNVRAVLDDSAITDVQTMRQMLLLRVEKIDVLNELLSVVGYGGLIHQFKNFVLRGDIRSHDQVIARYQQAERLLERYKKIVPISEGELFSLEQVYWTLNSYKNNLDVVQQMQMEKASVSQIDKRVMVDDRAALKGLFNLGNGIPDISADKWFVSATKRIDLFKTLSDELQQQSLRYIDKKTQRAYSHLIILLSITLATLLLALYFGVVITKRLVTGSAHIIEALSQVERSGDYSGHIEVSGQDEIAAMGHSFNNLIEGRQAAEKELWLAAKVFSSTIDGIMVTDSDERIISINPAFTAITGYSEKDVIGQTPRLLGSNRHDGAFFNVMWESIEKDNFWQGEVWNRRKCGEVYPQWQHISVIRDEQQQLINYISVFSDISELKYSQEKLEHLAHHDALTALPNRVLLDIHISQGIERAKRQNSVLAVLFLDLDRFKNINDSLGHPAGDDLLKQVSLRLKGLVRAEDLVARLGGDEFALVLESPADGQSIARIAQKCIDAFVPAFKIDTYDVFTTTSLGISIFPDDGDSTEKLLKHADTAMYHAKEQGRNSYCFYNRQMTQFAVDRLALEVKLRHAIDQNELILQYQPQISLTTGEIMGVEALVRWQQADGTLIPPDQFIPVAEESALIEKIDRWVLEEACLQAQKWLDLGLPSINIAINISGFSIEHGLLLDMVEEALEKSQLNPAVLELEITEGYLMQHREQATMIIDSLREQGVTFSIDDFGTGYSSLGYLKTLPINRLKIDQSFIRDLPNDENDRAITQAVIALGHSMQMKVVAEGVESVEQADYLKELGCDFAQGYLYSKPLSAEAIAAKLCR